MKRIFLLVLVAVFLSAATVKAADTFKTGFIDLQRALIESDAGKKAKLDLEALEKSKKTAIDEKVKAISKIEEELNKQASVLSADAKKAKENELEKLQRDVQRAVADARAELQKKEGELTEAILKDMSGIVDAFAQEEGYSLIVRSEVVLYADKGMDLTDILIKKFNESKGTSKENTKEKSKGKK